MGGEGGEEGEGGRMRAWEMAVDTWEGRGEKRGREGG